jgi:hypothetical protein
MVKVDEREHGTLGKTIRTGASVGSEEIDSLRRAKRELQKITNHISSKINCSDNEI